MIRRKTGVFNQNETPDELVHYRPFPDENLNVRCLNGSAHVLVSDSMDDVTCLKCRDEKTHSNYWGDWMVRTGKIF